MARRSLAKQAEKQRGFYVHEMKGGGFRVFRKGRNVAALYGTVEQAKGAMLLAKVRRAKLKREVEKARA